MRARATILVLGFLVASLVLAAGQIGAPHPGTTAIKITSPQPNAKLTRDYVTVQFELTNRPAVPATSPDFQISLDGGTPVLTTMYEQPFTGLTPGKHRVVIQLVDANNTPVAGARAEVEFTVLLPTAAPAGQTVPQAQGSPQGQLQTVAATQPQGDADPLPATGSALPLLSVIGFGILVGGVASALKTR